MRLLISGYRNYNDEETIKKEILDILKKGGNHTIIHGGCKRVDLIAGKIAYENGINVEVHKADWKKGKYAGPERNEEMIIKGKPDYALLFLSENSKGTLNMKNLLEKYGIDYTQIDC